MNRFTFQWMAVTATLLAPNLCYPQVSCTREGLKAATELYIAAQTTGDIAGLPLAKGLGYVENFKPINISDGLIMKAMKIDHQSSLLDTATCQTFTEVIVSDKANPYALGTRLRVNHGLIAEIEMLWTTTGYWLFNADNYLKYTSSEDWGTIPSAKRDNRETLVSAANAYLDAFLEGKMDLVPWGLPCNRTEGGMRTGKGAADDSCQVGVPSGVNIAEPALRGGWRPVLALSWRFALLAPALALAAAVRRIRISSGWRTASCVMSIRLRIYCRRMAQAAAGKAKARPRPTSAASTAHAGDYATLLARNGLA